MALGNNFYWHQNAENLPRGTSSGFTVTNPTFMGGTGHDTQGRTGTSSGFNVDPTFMTGGAHDTEGRTGAPSSFTPNTKFVGNMPHTKDGPGGRPIANTPKDPNAGGSVSYDGNAVPGAGMAPPEAPLAGPGYQEDWYKTYGQDLMRSPSASEDLYSRGVEGSNPFYDYAQEQTIKAINDAAAARGGFNSSYTMKSIQNAVADLRGQQAHELGQLAGQADQGKFGRYDRGNEYSGDAQRTMEKRATGGLNYEMELSKGLAGLVGDFYGEGGKQSMQAKMAEIEAALKKSGLSAEETRQMLETIFSVGEVITSAVG